MAESSSELPFERPKTAREEAAAAERSKRDAEMAEIRRSRASMLTKQGSVQLSAADQSRIKREQEMEELRKMKAGDYEETRRRLAEKGGPLTTDMDAWRSNQWGAKENDRKKKIEAQSNLHGHSGYQGGSTTGVDKGAYRKAQLEAQSNLHGHRGYDHKKTAADLDKDALSQAQRDRVSAMKGLNLGEGEDIPDGGGEDYDEDGMKAEAEERKKPGKLRGSVMFKDAPAEEIPALKKNGVRVSFKNAPEAAAETAAEAAEPEEAKSPPEEAKSPPEEAKSPPEEAETESAPEPVVAVPTVPVPVALKPPTYGRVDIKFSFGLIVRSSSADGFGENLRDNETLRKCMEGTSKILKEKLPQPPDATKPEYSRSSFMAKFPEAYYDPTLEPTIISIEEDKKNEDSQKKTAKGNKRTLVKASFPVFLRDEADDEEGTKRSSRMLKETKTTVFKALRAAVSGGSFLR